MMTKEIPLVAWARKFVQEHQLIHPTAALFPMYPSLTNSASFQSLKSVKQLWSLFIPGRTFTEICTLEVLCSTTNCWERKLPNQPGTCWKDFCGTISIYHFELDVKMSQLTLNNQKGNVQWSDWHNEGIFPCDLNFPCMKERLVLKSPLIWCRIGIHCGILW